MKSSMRTSSALASRGENTDGLDKRERREMPECLGRHLPLRADRSLEIEWYGAGYCDCAPPPVKLYQSVLLWNAA